MYKGNKKNTKVKLLQGNIDFPQTNLKCILLPWTALDHIVLLFIIIDWSKKNSNCPKPPVSVLKHKKISSQSLCALYPQKCS